MERRAEAEETSRLLDTLSGAALEARGVSILRLAVVDEDSGLGGRILLGLERTTGEPDERLLAHLQASDAKLLTTNAIAETQWLLNGLGYLNGEGGGIMGAKSIAAIRSSQGDRGFTVTGQPSMELLSKLRAEPIREPGAGSF